MRTLLILLLTISFISCGKEKTVHNDTIQKKKYESYVEKNQFQYLESKIVLNNKFSQTFLLEPKDIKEIHFNLNGLLQYQVQEISNHSIDRKGGRGRKSIDCNYDKYNTIQEKISIVNQDASLYFDIYLNNIFVDPNRIVWSQIPKNKILKIDLILKKHLTDDLISGYKFLKGSCLKEKYFIKGQRDKIINKNEKVSVSPKIEGSITIEVENYIFTPTSSPK